MPGGCRVPRRRSRASSPSTSATHRPKRHPPHDAHVPAAPGRRSTGHQTAHFAAGPNPSRITPRAIRRISSSSIEYLPIGRNARPACAGYQGVGRDAQTTPLSPYDATRGCGECVALVRPTVTEHRVDRECRAAERRAMRWVRHCGRRCSGVGCAVHNKRKFSNGC